MSDRAGDDSSYYGGPMALRRRPPKDFERGRYERCPGPVRLYLDDVDDLLAFISGRAKRVELLADDAVADTADDLKSATRKELKELEIEARDPRVWVPLHTNRACALTWTEDDAEAKALVDDVYRLLRQRRSAATLIFATLPLYGILLLTGMAVAAFRDDELDVYSKATYLTFVVFAVVGTALYYYSAFVRGWCRVVLDRRSLRRVVTATTARQAIVALITGVIVAAATAYLTVKFSA